MRAALLLALFLLPACESPQQGALSGPVSTDIFEDLPAPKGAQYRQTNAESFSYHGETFRCGRFAYDYRGNHAETVQFFKTTMTSPPYNWTFATQHRSAAESTTLVFTKHNDRCTVDIDRVAEDEDGRDHLELLVRLNFTR
ncbi:MAG: hypothetical protein ACYTGV_20215 [Planctomycetota bacterium]|jgi:hypothetical protein